MGGSGWREKTPEGKLGKIMAGKSSNLHELKNLMETLEVLAREVRLTWVKKFIFTDNITAEAT